MGEMATVIKELRNAAAAIEEAAKWLAQQFGEQQPAPTLEDVRAVLARKSAEGHTTDVQALIRKYGAAKLSQVDPAHYAALMAEAEAI